MDTTIFRGSYFTDNSSIYCCLIFNTIKRTYSIKSLIYRENSPDNRHYYVIFLMACFMFKKEIISIFA
jgi:hypothetical protein